MKRTEVGSLKIGKTVTVHGWVDTLRDQKSMIFLVIRDRSGRVQVVIKKAENPEMAAAVEGLLTGSTVVVKGEVKDAPQVKLGGIEIVPISLTVTSRADVSPIDEKSGLDLLLDYRWLDLRDEKKLLYFQVQTAILKAMRDWFVQAGFIEIMTPKLNGSVTEGGAEVFEVKYFDQKAYLTQSPQFFKQMGIAAGFEKVFEVGGCYRAEKSFTSRHATEFFALDVEIGFIDDEHDVMDAEEAMLKYVLKQVVKTCAPIFKKLNIDVEVPNGRFPRITLMQAYELLREERGYEVPKAAKGDLDPEAERLLCEISKEKWGSEFIFITNFPWSARPFYVMRMDGNKFTRGFDLLYKGVEITSGGQREHTRAALEESCVMKGINPADMNNYIQFFDYGCPPHGGYALGLARFCAKVLGLPSVKDTTFLFRGPQRLAP
ncbi:MAG: aspartate--tRNA(Asn) ligase [Firmicutes bacterium]|nr:aspartate--tRNA(Asn) ligase [Bacillota bacterium]